MVKVTDFLRYREEHQEHVAGEAVCVSCKHTWVAVAPTEVKTLECPNCKSHHGRFKNMECLNLPHWVCECGSFEFHLTTKGPYCSVCGDPAPVTL